MSSSHILQNYARRNSAASPYSIPANHNHRSFLSLSHGSDGHTHDHLHSQIRAQSYSTKSPSRLPQSGPSISRGLAARRISEGESGRLKLQLTCEACGKGYKHISSLAKHLWEHTPEWKMTKKLVMSKHQQVQLLEAASILVGMNDPLPEEESVEPSSLRIQRRLSQRPESLRFSDSFGTLGGFEVDQYPPTNLNRSHSISAHPPLAVEISRLYPGHVGGYIDVPSREYIVKRRESEVKEELEEAAESDEEIIGKME